MSEYPDGNYETALRKVALKARDDHEFEWTLRNDPTAPLERSADLTSREAACLRQCYRPDVVVEALSLAERLRPSGAAQRRRGMLCCQGIEDATLDSAVQKLAAKASREACFAEDLRVAPRQTADTHDGLTPAERAWIARAHPGDWLPHVLTVASALRGPLQRQRERQERMRATLERMTAGLADETWVPASLALVAGSTERIQQLTGDVDVVGATFSVDSTALSQASNNAPPSWDCHLTAGYYTGPTPTPGLTTTRFQVDGADGHVAFEGPTPPDGKPGLLWLFADLSSPLGVQTGKPPPPPPGLDYPDVLGWSTSAEDLKAGGIAIKFYKLATPTFREQVDDDNHSCKTTPPDPTYTVIFNIPGTNPANGQPFDLNGGNGPDAGITVNGQPFIAVKLLANQGSNPTPFNQQTVLVTFNYAATEPEEFFSFFRTLSIDHSGGGKFIRTAFVIDGDFVMIFGTGSYQAPADKNVANLFLARIKRTEFGDPQAQMHFFTGTNFSGTSEADATPLLDEAVLGVFQDFSVQKIEDVGWLLLFNSNTIQSLWATSPQGPWSFMDGTLLEVTDGNQGPDAYISNATMANGGVCTNGVYGPAIPGASVYGLVYRPAIVPGLTEVTWLPGRPFPTALVRVSWTVSTNVPYYGHLMSTEFLYIPGHYSPPRGGGGE